MTLREPTKAYKVTLRCTNGVRDTVFVKDDDNDSSMDPPGDFLKVRDGLAFVITDDPQLIFDFFGISNVDSLEFLGYGYDVE